MTNHPNRRRIWTTSIGTVCLRDDSAPLSEEESTREFWVPSSGGYIREIDEKHPGTLGAQVCDRLARLGNTLYASRETLEEVIRREYRNAIAHKKRFNG